MNNLEPLASLIEDSDDDGSFVKVSSMQQLKAPSIFMETDPLPQYVLGTAVKKGEWTFNNTENTKDFSTPKRTHQPSNKKETNLPKSPNEEFIPSSPIISSASRNSKRKQLIRINKKNILKSPTEKGKSLNVTHSCPSKNDSFHPQKSESVNEECVKNDYEAAILFLCTLEVHMLDRPLYRQYLQPG